MKTRTSTQKNIVAKSNQVIILATLFLSLFFINSTWSTPRKIGIVISDGFLMKNIIEPATYFDNETNGVLNPNLDLLVISAKESLKVSSAEGASIVANYTIYESHKLDVLLIPQLGNIEVDVLIEYVEKLEGAIIFFKCTSLPCYKEVLPMMNLVNN